METLKTRFEKHPERHEGLEWDVIAPKLASHLEVIQRMEDTGGEPDVVAFPDGMLAVVDCSSESPKGRRSLCYDRAAWESRKEFKPVSSAMEQAAGIGVELLDEDQYRALQTMGTFDLKTSSWLKTPSVQRKLGGAIFGDRRYNRVFIYHNGAESYYASRGFRGLLKIS